MKIKECTINGEPFKNCGISPEGANWVKMDPHVLTEEDCHMFFPSPFGEEMLVAVGVEYFCYNPHDLKLGRVVN